jgi:hypothetical protein
MNVYVIGRSATSNRPTVMHKLNGHQATITACGVDVSNVSRSFTNKPIESVLCLKAGCRS